MGWDRMMKGKRNYPRTRRSLDGSEGTEYISLRLAQSSANNDRAHPSRRRGAQCVGCRQSHSPRFYPPFRFAHHFKSLNSAEREAAETLILRRQRLDVDMWEIAMSPEEYGNRLKSVLANVDLACHTTGVG